MSFIKLKKKNVGNDCLINFKYNHFLRINVILVQNLNERRGCGSLGLLDFYKSYDISDNCCDDLNGYHNRRHFLFVFLSHMNLLMFQQTAT